MPDYGRAVKFGYFLIPNAEAPLLKVAQEVERLGLDYVAVQDHPYQRRFVDTWVLLSMIAATASRIGLFPKVGNLPWRPPGTVPICQQLSFRGHSRYKVLQTALALF